MLLQSIIISSRGVAKHASLFEEGLCLIESSHVKDIEKMVEDIIGLVEQVDVDIVVDFENFMHRVGCAEI